jgi:exopolysaccharide production protein ExoQ
MPPSLASLLWLILLLALLCFDPTRDRKTSLAVWVPSIWLFIVGSRLPSQWFDGQMGLEAQALEEGSPLDRTIFFALILLAIGILVSRSFKWGGFFARNLALMAFLFFTLLSASWSDFPFVAFKRWFRDLGNYVMILVVLSDPLPLEAARTLLRRLGYLVVPLSILLIRYYAPIGIHYSFWSGAPEYVGATTSKNMLGVACLISGLFFFWDTVTRWSRRQDRRTRRVIFLNVAFIAMTLWLLNLSSSTTSRLCLTLGWLVIAATHSSTARRHPALLKVLIPTGVCLYIILAFGFGMDINASIANAVGRDPTLTGRTNIWNTVLSLHTNPLVGTGYESFWLGPRLFQVWRRAGVINEAHNGYLKVYLNLGLFGRLFSYWISNCQLPDDLQTANVGFSLWLTYPCPLDHFVVLQHHRGILQGSPDVDYLLARSARRPAALTRA